MKNNKITINSKIENIGSFCTYDEAKEAYRKYKAKHIKDIALTYKDSKIKLGLLKHAELFL